MNSKEIIKLLETNGWRIVRKRGSHCQFKHMSKPGLVTVPHPKKDIPVGTLKSVLKQAGLEKGDK